MLLVVCHIGEECVVDIKDPRVFSVSSKRKRLGEEQSRLISSSLHISLVLRRAHVLAHIVDAFSRHVAELSDVVDLHIELPAVTVVLQAHAQIPTLSPKIVQYVP